MVSNRGTVTTISTACIISQTCWKKQFWDIMENTACVQTVQMKYLWAWETNWTCTAMLAHATLLSFIPTVVRMSLTSSYRPACVICLYSILLLSNSFILQFSKISKHWCYKIPTVYSLRQTCYVYVSIIVMCTDNNNGETGPHKRQS